jgi:lipoprotein
VANKIVCAMSLILIILITITGCEKLPEDVYTTEDVEITGTITKQYITEEDRAISAFEHVTDVYYYTVIDYGGDNLKVVTSQSYYNKHNVGDKVKLVKHRIYKNGKWLKTEVKTK